MDKAERARRAVLVTSVLRAMVGMGVLGFIGSLFDPANDLRVTFGFYGLAFLGLAALGWITKRGYVLQAAWVMSIFFWVLIAAVTLFFGGLHGQYAACFTVCAMLIGTVVSGRAGIGIGLLSSAWCGLVAWLDATNRLPPSLGPPFSPMNAWIALCVTLVLTAVLTSFSQESLRQLHVEAETSAKERDEALRKSINSQKMELVGNLASGVAHDFNNLLMVMTATSEQLRSATSDGERHELLRDLDEATTRATLMTRQLLAMGRSQATALVPIDLSELVQGFGTMLPRLLGSRVAVKLDAPIAVWTSAARAGLEQILLNLAVNARDAMPAGGTLFISVAVDGNRARLEFRDTGVGMDSATLARIFQPFFTTRASGTGLGLATVHQRVADFAGTIDVKSEVGKGTRFTIHLPLLPSLETMIAVVAPPRERTRTERILLVEDDARVRRSVTGLLEQSGFEVIGVSNGAEALQLLVMEHRFACVVTDLSMPVLDGDGLAAKLETIAPSLPLVMMSGNRDPQQKPGKRRTFVEKPVTREALVSAIDRVLADPDMVGA